MEDSRVWGNRFTGTSTQMTDRRTEERRQFRAAEGTDFPPHTNSVVTNMDMGPNALLPATRMFPLGWKVWALLPRSILQQSSALYYLLLISPDQKGWRAESTRLLWPPRMSNHSPSRCIGKKLHQKRIGRLLTPYYGIAISHHSFSEHNRYNTTVSNLVALPERLNYESSFSFRPQNWVWQRRSRTKTMR